MKEKLFLYIFFIIFLISSKSIAKSIPISKNIHSQYIFYKVKKGDTLYRISKNYNVSLAELKRLNNLFHNNIYVGQILKIPVQLNTKQKNTGIKKTYYIVKKGDTLYSISKKYGVSVEELKKINNLKTSKIKIGQKLIVYEAHQILQNEEEAEKDFILYEVKEGETLYTISLKTNVPINLLKSLNNLKDNVVFVGQKLKIPYDPIKEKPFLLENPTLYFKEDSSELLFQKFSINFLSKSIIDEKDENLLQKRFLKISQQYKNYKYRLGGNGNGYLDCSMFVKLIYKNLGIELPRTSREQFLVGIPVKREELIPGDLVFFSRYRNKRRISHVGIYIGNNKFIHFSSSRKGFAIDSLNKPYFNSRFVGAKRIINGEILERFYTKKEGS